MADDELRVRQLAYRIWESEGRPEGQQQRHWDMALKIVAAERASGHDAHVEEVGAPHDETPIFEDDLPLEDDEIGIQENRLPLDDPEEAPFDEVPFRDDQVVGQDVPVQDRGTPEQTPIVDPGAGSMEPLPEGSATAERTEHPRRTEDTLTQTDATDTSQVPGKTAATSRSRKSATKGTAKSAAKKPVTEKAAAKKTAKSEAATSPAGSSSRSSKNSAEKSDTAKKTTRTSRTPKPKG
ncbi:MULTISPECIES: DUF2934 domain-containing protein [Halomonadaceae]|uniref:DUF2934 domain-containing protein n=1 Tax=Halomonadaceae TaxID=28256 RepID=UPI001598F6EA|nr:MULTISPECIES: DUF2934 domain-containing protein [Halomonas]QJQ95825.1 DUF2934 domain-containing protein [Halomonas sp. PA5]